MRISLRSAAKRYSVTYFNGFSLQGEAPLFKAYLLESDFCVAGFSYGAQQALEFVYRSERRVDRLILLSPAFFQQSKKSFVRTQLRYFDANREAYVAQFLKNVAYPSDIDLSPYLVPGSREALDSLLNYVWDEEKIREILERGTIIELFLGEKDRIIDAKAALDFFSPLVTVYYIKDAGHLLQ